MRQLDLTRDLSPGSGIGAAGIEESGMAGRLVAGSAAGSEATTPARAVPTGAVDWDVVAARLTWAAFAVVVLLGAAAPVVRTGDAHQYYAMAAALAELRPPALTGEEVAAFKAWLNAQPAASGFPGSDRVVEQPALVVDGRQEFSHFWFYPLLVAPFVAAAGAAGFHPGYGFLLANAALLGLALWRVGRSFPPAVALLLLASPVVWFVNKAQVELFTFAVLCLAMAEARRGRYLWAGLAVAVASTQNAPIVAAVPLFWAAGLVRHASPHPQPLSQPWERGAFRLPSPGIGGGVGGGGRNWGFGRTRGFAPTRQFGPTITVVALIATTLVVGALHPLYYLWRLGVLTPQRLNGGIAAGIPSLERYLAVLVDPDLGLLPWLPASGLLAVIGLVLLVRPGRALPWVTLDLRLAAAVGVLTGAWFLFVFAQTTNVNSGGTVHISRYALWLLPLGLPLLEATARWLRPRAPVLLPALALTAFALYAGYFRPAQPERYVVPSPQSELLIAWLPALYRPVPEVFYERRLGVDGGVRGSAADRGCRVILVSDGSPAPPCPLTREEREAADALLGGEWQAVWIVRPGRLGLGDGGVRGAIRRP